MMVDVTRRPSSSSAARGAARALTAALAALVLVGIGAGAAQAHNALRSTDPADGSTVTVVPERLTLTFDQPATAIGTEVVVVAPDGRTVSVGEPVLLDASVSQPIEGELPAGTYTVQWRVTSADGHPLSGELTFTAAEATAIGVEPTADPEPRMTANAEPGEVAPSPDVTATDPATNDLTEPVSAEPAETSSTPLVLAVLAALIAAGVVAVAVRQRRK
ncbi:copper resistance protein CopC [Cellulomonas sp. P22]|uniref:copper resistance protein CopC n=1 Tax=Cellulomonas sp. P22 TaxID=3373189 RepID=UPI0037B129BD